MQRMFTKLEYFFENIDKNLQLRASFNNCSIFIRGRAYITWYQIYVFLIPPPPWWYGVIYPTNPPTPIHISRDISILQKTCRISIMTNKSINTIIPDAITLFHQEQRIQNAIISQSDWSLVFDNAIERSTVGHMGKAISRVVWNFLLSWIDCILATAEASSARNAW